MSANGADTKKLKTGKEMAEFDAIFSELVDDLTNTGMKNQETADAFAWFRGVLQYNVPHGKKNRGICVVTSYKLLVPDAQEADLKIARVLGWGVELLQNYYLVVDDIVDHSLTRRGKPCWYKMETVGLKAINDAFFLECCVYTLLKKYARDKPYYMKVMELFWETTLETVTGECLDLITGSSDKIDFTHFTMERYSVIAKWKTSFVSVYLPVAIAMHMAGMSDEESHSKSKIISLEIGHFFQVQNDYLDCYGPPEVVGKIGTDIQDNKCGWLIVKALELASKEQIELLKKNYGKWDEEAVEQVKAIYKDLDLEGIWKKYDESSYQEIINLINASDSKVPKEVFLDFVNWQSKRQK